MQETKTFSEILLRRRNKLNIIAKIDSKNNNVGRVLIMMKNINNLGYTFSKSLIEYIGHLTVDEQNDIYKEIVPCLKEYVGADKKWSPMYPNFPTQVQEMDDWELFVNAVIHYISGGTLIPDYEKDERLPLFESHDLTVLDYAENEELDDLLKNLISSKTSLSETDKEDMIYLIKNNGININNLPDSIPFKENVAIICKMIMDNTSELIWYFALHKYLNTATDVLRFLTYLSDGDVSLATNTKFKSLPRKKRRLVLKLLDNCNNIEEDMKRHGNKWIAAGETLHPSEYKMFEKVNVAFKKLREKEKIEMFGGKVDRAIKSGNVKTALDLLKTRPGELARCLDYIIRTNLRMSKNVIDAFSSIAEKISVPVLLQVREHFHWREKLGNSRVFFPKGSLAKCYTIENNLKPIPKDICLKIAIICDIAIEKQLKSKKSLGKVYIDNSIKGFCVPQSQRSASKSLKPVIRGSLLPISPNTKSCRGFIWWTNVDDYGDMYDSRVDIDLSAAILDENFNYLSHLSYTNLRSAKFRSYHSGDITNGGHPNGKGACEFIDVDIDSVVKNNGRYIIYQVYSFTGQKFSDLTNVMFGWMEREDVASGEVFEPSTVEQRIDLTSMSTYSIPVLFDCLKREYIWMDISGNINSNNRIGANLERNLYGTSAICYGIINAHKPQMYDLALMNANARGTLVTNRDDADTIFDTNTEKPIIEKEKIIETRNEKGEIIDVRTEKQQVIKECRIITPYDIDVWMGEML